MSINLKGQVTVSIVEKGNLGIGTQEGHVRHSKHEDALQRKRKRNPQRK